MANFNADLGNPFLKRTIDNLATGVNMCNDISEQFTIDQIRLIARLSRISKFFVKDVYGYKQISVEEASKEELCPIISKHFEQVKNFPDRYYESDSEILLLEILRKSPNLNLIEYILNNRSIDLNNPEYQRSFLSLLLHYDAYKNSFPPRRIASEFYSQRMYLLRLFLKYGANPDQQTIFIETNPNGNSIISEEIMTPIEYAQTKLSEYPYILQLLQSYSNKYDNSSYKSSRT